MNTTLKYSLIAALLVPTTASMAQDNKESGLYLGGNYGLLKVKGADEFEDDQDMMQGIIGGQLNKYFAIEGSLIYFGEYGGNVAQAEVDGKTLALKAMYPFTEHFAVYGKGGQLWWDLDYTIDGGLLGSYKGDTDGSEPFWGVGVAFGLTENLDLNLEYTRYNVEFEAEEIGAAAAFVNRTSYETDLEQASVGLQYLF